VNRAERAGAVVLLCRRCRAVQLLLLLLSAPAANRRKSPPFASASPLLSKQKAIARPHRANDTAGAFLNPARIHTERRRLFHRSWLLVRAGSKQGQSRAPTYIFEHRRLFRIAQAHQWQAGLLLLHQPTAPAGCCARLRRSRRRCRNAPTKSVRVVPASFLLNHLTRLLHRHNSSIRVFNPAIQAFSNVPRHGPQPLATHETADLA